MRFITFILALASCGASQHPDGVALQPDAPTALVRGAADPGKRRLVRIWFNPYIDSIKPVLNYYVSVDGELSDGSFLPMDSTYIRLTADRGELRGNEWIIPKVIDFDRVTFRAEAYSNPALRDSITIWIKRTKDPRDAPDYSGED